MGVAGLCVMGWVLTASGSLAGPLDVVRGFPLDRAQSEQRRLERPEIVDPGSGAALKLGIRAGGALQASLTWLDLDVVKVTHANGDFHARVAARQDLLVLVRTGNRLRVTRDGQTAVLALDRIDEEGLDLVQAVLAGSHAARMFRGVYRHLGEDARDSAPGVSVDLLDAWLGLLQGEPGAIDRRAPAARDAGWRVSRAACGAGPTCYSEYETEVIQAWGDYVQCIDDVRWYPGLQEVCALTWLLRVESAWFRFIGCSSIPLKAT
jgi:hypothetical protein